MINRLNVSNLGPIKRAEVEFKDLTIICGRNGVGKTYLSYTQYIIAKRFQYALAKSMFLPKTLHYELDQFSTQGFSRFKHTFSLDYLADVFIEAKSSLSGDKTKQRVLSALDIDDKPNTSIEASFGKDPLSLVYDYDGGVMLSVSSDCKIELEKKRGSYDLTVILQNADDSKLNVESLREDVEFIVSVFVIEHILKTRRFAITSERTGISYFQDVLTSQQRKTIYREEEEEDTFNGFSEPIRDNIQIYQRIKSTKYPYNSWMRRNKQSLLKIAEDIVGGEYVTEKGKFFFKPKGQSKLVPLRSSSGASKALLLIDFFIWNYTTYGSLIIDEPELNLHLDNQKAIARLLCAIANLGVQVVVTTHSDHFVREVNNLIMLSSDKIKEHEKQEIMKKGNIRKISIIKPENVSTVVISASNRRTFKMDIGEYGIDLSLFNEEILSGNEIANDLMMAIYSSEVQDDNSSS